MATIATALCFKAEVVKKRLSRLRSEPVRPDVDTEHVNRRVRQALRLPDNMRREPVSDAAGVTRAGPAL